ncbi:MAG: hypothetical protein ABIQ61_06750 [Ornithinibacter sp.]
MRILAVRRPLPLFFLLLIAATLGLPLVASVLDGPGTENWIIPVYLLVMAVIGTAVTLALPAMARAGAPTGMRALTGAAWGMLLALIGVLVFWLLLNGFHGA